MKAENKVKKMLLAIKMGVWRFILRAQNNGRLPGFKGSTIRGAFGMALKKMSCIAGVGVDCRECMVTENCMYSLTFESINNKKDKNKFLGIYEYIPHPFAFSDKSKGKRDYTNGEKLEFEMMLVEPYISKLPYYIYAIKNVGKFGMGKDNSLKFLLESVRSRDGAEIYNERDEKIDLSYKNSIIEAEKVMNGRSVDNQTIEFITPVRIKYDEKLVKKLNFKILVTSLLRRASGIAAHYAGVPVDVDAEEYLKDSADVDTEKDELMWYDWERYSNRQKKMMKMGGLVGKIKFKGKKLRKYLPLLRVGEILKVGKGTSMGLGEYRMI